jgi:hypothetical protein
LEFDAANNGLNFSAQEFSFRDAREHLYKALTRPTEDDRAHYFGRTFQSVGHIIHHLQDMAQPQHVRNDAHCDLGICALLGQFNPSRYEKFTLANPEAISPHLSANAVTFDRFRDFWTNSSGSGLAQFTNRNFVSAGTNFRMRNGQIVSSSDYANPRPVPSTEAPIGIQQLLADNGLPPARDQGGNLLQGEITFIGSLVDGQLNPRASTLSLFDQDLAKYNATVVYPGVEIVTVDRMFTLNRFNFYAAYPYLIPKAVAYSAGMIDYFFRGKIDLDIEYDEATEGQYVIENKGDEVMKGDFTLYYDAIDGKRYPVAGDSDTTTWRNVTIQPNEKSAPLNAPKTPSDPKPKFSEEYSLVFTGSSDELTPMSQGKNA